MEYIKVLKKNMRVIMSKVIVVGGGASGLVATIYASKNNDVVVLEKNSKCAKKILVTGNGKGNYWNSDFTKDHFNFSDSTWINSIITKENKEEHGSAASHPQTAKG